MVVDWYRQLIAVPVTVIVVLLTIIAVVVVLLALITVVVDLLPDIVLIRFVVGVQQSNN